jgi:hypothetical protein
MSANLVAYDWNTLQNVIYVQDFPLKSQHHSNDSTEFENNLKQMLNDLNVPEIIARGIQSFDFSSAKVSI